MDETKVRYWVHHESNCLIRSVTQKDEDDLSNMFEVEEIDRDTYFRLFALGYTRHE